MQKQQANHWCAYDFEQYPLYNIAYSPRMVEFF
jgi:hypothetical protein